VVKVPLRALSVRFFFGSVLVLFSACGVPTEKLISDFAAIHRTDNFSPQSPAAMWYPPDSWSPDAKARPTRIGSLTEYDVEDHRQLDQWMLNWMASIPVSQTEDALEISGWLILTVLHDEYPESRLQAAAILAQLASNWLKEIPFKPSHQMDGDLAAAIHSIMESGGGAPDSATPIAMEASYALLDRSPLLEPNSTARLVVGLGRHLRRTDYLPDSIRPYLARLGIRAVLQTLEAGTKDPTTEVASACQIRLDLLRAHLP
jgi:hypothetical protein